MNRRELLIRVYRKGIKIIKTLVGRRIVRFYPVKIVYNFVYKFVISHLKSTFAKVDGHKMFLDSKDSLLLSINGYYEPFATELLKKEIKKGQVVLDIGAHIGYYTLIFARAVGKNGKVYAFEPDPTNFSLLKKNVEINGYNNVVMVQKAVTNRTEKVRLYLCEDDTTDHRIYNSYGSRKSIQIEAVRLDDYFNNYNGSINFIKMDIQGAEYTAVQGMFNLLKKNKDLKIFTEFFPIGLNQFGINPKSYLELLLKQGFKLYRINEEEKKIEPVNIAYLLEIYALEKGNHTNLLCIRKI